MKSMNPNTRNMIEYFYFLYARYTFSPNLFTIFINSIYNYESARIKIP